MQNSIYLNKGTIPKNNTSTSTRCRAKGAKVHPPTGNKDIHRRQVLAGGGVRIVSVMVEGGGVGAVSGSVVGVVPRTGDRCSSRVRGQKCRPWARRIACRFRDWVQRIRPSQYAKGSIRCWGKRGPECHSAGRWQTRPMTPKMNGNIRLQLLIPPGEMIGGRGEGGIPLWY